MGDREEGGLVLVLSSYVLNPDPLPGTDLTSEVNVDVFLQ